MSILNLLWIIPLIFLMVVRAERKSVLGDLAYVIESIVGWLTFPGVILRELSRKLFCDVAGIPVYEVKYFMLRNPQGYVLHGDVSRYRDTYLLTIGPFLVSTVFAMAMFILPCFGMPCIVDVLCFWLGASFAIHALPGDGDSQGLWGQTRRRALQNPFVYLGYPPVVVIAYAKKLKRMIRINLLYAVALYSITFCLVAAVLLAGSSAFPGVYSVKITSTGPAVTDMYTYEYPWTGITKYLPSYHPTSYPIRRSPSDFSRPRENIAGKEATAKDWLSTADAAMKKENARALLVYVHGYSNERGTMLPINGKCHIWWYEYAVPGENIVYDVYVHDGTLEELYKRTGSNYRSQIVDWTMSSADAVAITNANLTARAGDRVIQYAVYVLEVKNGPINKGNLTWTVAYQGSGDAANTTMYVDHDTGDIVYTWTPPK